MWLLYRFFILLISIDIGFSDDNSSTARYGGVGGGGVLLLSIVIIFCCRCCCRSCKDDHDGVTVTVAVADIDTEQGGMRVFTVDGGKTVWAVSIPDKPGDNTPTDADVNASVSSGAHPTSCTNTAVAGETNECDIPMANKSYSGSNEDTLGPPPAYSDVFYN